MANVLIVVHLLIVLALIGVILLQRSEGGGLGMGSSSNSMSRTRTSANLLTRTTAILAALFFATAIGLTVLNEVDRGSQGILENAIGTGAAGAGAGADEQPSNVLDALNRLQGEDEGLAVPGDEQDADAAAPDTGESDSAADESPAPSAPSSSDTTSTPATSGGPDLAVPDSGSATDNSSGN